MRTDLSLPLGRRGQFVGNGGHQVLVTSNGKVDRAESVGVDRQAEGFIGAIQDERITQLLQLRHASALGGHWQEIPGAAHQSFDCGDGRVWKFGGSQQVDIDLAQHTVSLNTLGTRGQHTVRASFELGSGRVNPRTITEEFAPYNAAYVAAMRDMY